MPKRTVWTAVFLIGLSGMCPFGSAAVYTVTTTADAGPGSLRDAIEAANLDEAEDTIVFDDALLDQTIVIEDLMPPIEHDLAIEGLGKDRLTIYADVGIVPDTTEIELFVVAENTKLELRGLKITNAFRAIRNEGTLFIDHCDFTDNGIHTINFGTPGSAIYNLGVVYVTEAATNFLTIFSSDVILMA